MLSADPSDHHRFHGLLIRTASALVLSAFVVSATLMGGHAYTFSVYAVLLVGLWEWQRLFFAGEHEPHPLFTQVYGVAAVIALVTLTHVPVIAGVAFAATLVLTGTLAGVLKVTGFRHALLFAGGAGYFTLAMQMLAMIGHVPETGKALAFFLFLVTWASDTAAYLVGTLVGGPRLIPNVSPRKTWAGAVAAVAVAVAMGVACHYFFALFTPRQAAVFGGLLSLGGQAGDLFISLVKRRFGQKDMSRLLPGHGGMLDRIDALLAASVIWFILLALFEGHNFWLMVGRAP